MSKFENGRISYLVIDTQHHKLAQAALRNSNTMFPLANRIVFSDQDTGWDATDFIFIEPLKSVSQYCEFLLTHAWKFVKTEFFIVLQYDGFVLNGKKFLNSFLDFDYIGAPWPHFDCHKVGNGGFSLRSKKLMNALQPMLSEKDFRLPEDIVICRKYRPLLELKSKIKFATVNVAEKFSKELKINQTTTFGFHGYKLLPLVYRHTLDILGMQNKPIFYGIQE